MREMNDSEDLPRMAAAFLIYITAVTPPNHLVEPLIKLLIATLRESTVSRLIYFSVHKSMLNVRHDNGVLEDPVAHSPEPERHLLPRASFDLGRMFYLDHGRELSPMWRCRFLR